MDESAPEKLHYLLVPVYAGGSRIYTPVDNSYFGMRSIMSREEAERLVEHIPEVAELDIRNERDREECYKTVLKNCDSVQLVQVLKALYQRKQSRLAVRKKFSALDDKYLKLAEERLHGELAVSLGLERDRVEAYIQQRLHEK